MVESRREVCGSVRVGGKNPKSVCWNSEIKAAVRRKKAAWKEVLVASYEAKETCMEVYIEEKRKVKRCIYHSKKKVNEQYGRKVNEDVNGNIKLFWKEVDNEKEEGEELQQNKGWKWEVSTGEGINLRITKKSTPGN